jgi:hypothetical protein
MGLALQDFDLCDRTYWGYDSFRGLPGVVEEDKAGSLLTGREGEFNAGYASVKANFDKFKLGARIRLVQGW